MLTQFISQYLKTHRRLNIPGVGAFIVKGEGSREILFSELLKKDDGVLRTLLLESGLRDIEVEASIDRLAFEIRHVTEQVGGVFVMEGFGVLRRMEGGKLLFVDYAEYVAAQEEPIKEQEPIKEDEPIKEEEVPTKEEVVEPEPKEAEEAKEPKEAEEAEAAKDPNSVVEPTSRYSKERIKMLYSSPQSFRTSDPSVEDLTYSKRQKPLGGYTYVRRGASKRGVDKVLLFGIIAAVIAVGVIAYGYYVGHVEEITEMMISWGLKSADVVQESM